jgi:hypothetical protein
VLDGVTLNQLQNENAADELVNSIFIGFLKEANTKSGDTVIDAVTVEADLGINALMRKTVLDDNGMLVVDLSEQGDGDFNPVIFEVHDKLTETSVIIDGIKIVGLDSLQTFSPFLNIGAATISNAMKWEKLTIELDLTVDMKPSSLPDATIPNTNFVNVVEKTTIQVDLAG